MAEAAAAAAPLALSRMCFSSYANGGRQRIGKGLAITLTEAQVVNRKI